jgi:hypothetical protein
VSARGAPRLVLTRAAACAAASLAASLAACASGNPELDTQTTRVRETTRLAFQGGSLAVELLADDRIIEQELEVSPERAWSVLPAVYAALDLPVTTLVSDTRLIGTQGAQAPRRLGGEPLSRAVSCGSAAFGQDNADLYEVTLLTLSDIRPRDGGSTLRTLVRGSARAQGGSDAAVRCASRGRIEQRIGTLVREWLAAARR